MPNPLSHVAPYPGDPILSLMADFQHDARAHKVSLGVGLYFDEHGQIPVLECVRRAMRAIDAQPQPCGYLPMEGLQNYRLLAQQLAFGVPQENIASIQTLGGSGALKIGADFIKAHFPQAAVWLSEPSWENHAAIFGGAGFAVHYYPYYDRRSADNLCFAQTLQTIARIPTGDILLLHASCHNPSGVDWSQAQWQQVFELAARQRLLVFFDMAYQGFGEGLEADAWPVRQFAASAAQAGCAAFVAQSFSKNFSLYGERVGALHVVCADGATADHVLGQLKATVRRNYSSPPTRGASLVQHILAQGDLRALWQQELGGMRQRMQNMRAQLHGALQARGIAGFDFLLRQRGMFSYTGLSPQQVQHLRAQYGIYLVGSGRLCVCGLAPDNIGHVADALAALN